MRSIRATSPPTKISRALLRKWARYDPYVWNIDSSGFLSFKAREGGGVLLPYQDLYAKLKACRHLRCEYLLYTDDNEQVTPKIIRMWVERAEVAAGLPKTGRLRILGSITHPNAVGEILERLAIPTEAPRAARARDPTDFEDAAAD